MLHEFDPFSDDYFDPFSGDNSDEDSQEEKPRSFWIFGPEAFSGRPDVRETVQQYMGDLLLALEYLPTSRPEVARAFVSGYARLLRVDPRIVRSSRSLRNCLAEAARAWEERGSTYAALATRDVDLDHALAVLRRKLEYDALRPETAKRLLDELDTIELLHWALQYDSQGRRLSNFVEQALAAVFRRVDLFLPAKSEARRIALVVGNGKAVAHDRLLCRSLAKFKALLVVAAREATGDERYRCIKLARQLPPHGRLWKELKEMLR